MKRIFFTLMFLSFSVLNVFAHGPNDVILHGIVVDNETAAAHKNDLSAALKTYTKDQALAAAKSGYSIYADGTLYPLTDGSNTDVVNFLKGNTSVLQVTIIAEKQGDKFWIERIVNKRIVHNLTKAPASK